MLLKTLSESPQNFFNIPSLIVRDPLRGTTAIFCGQDLLDSRSFYTSFCELSCLDTNTYVAQPTVEYIYF